MKKIIIPLTVLALLAFLSAGAAAGKSPLGKAVAPLFNSPEKVKEVSYAAWQTAKDQGLRASLLKSAELLKRAAADVEEAPTPQDAADTFAAWWYNVAAQYWSDLEAKKPGGEEFVKAGEAIRKARQDLEKAWGWDAKAGEQAFQMACRLLEGYK
jgi:hypothetical protein